MNNSNTHILNSFIKAPDLKFNSAEDMFEYFYIEEDVINDSEFHFPRNSIIGLQAEACFKAYLNLSKRYRLLSSNLQIQGDSQTLGELDFIVKNLETKKVIHIELACKFYLYDREAGISEMERWIGPNRKDSLFDKFEKTRTKQFPLIKTKEAKARLSNLNIDFPSSQELCFKAFLFIPQDMISEGFSKEYKDCIIGTWIYHSDFKNDDSDSLYAIPNKKEWLLPIEHITTWYSFDRIASEVNNQLQNGKSPLIYKRTPEKTERFFVVWW